MGRKTFIIAGTVTSVCLAFPAISAVHDGYKVFALPDASGTYSKMVEEISLARMVQAGIIPMDTSSAIAELQFTWHREDWKNGLNCGPAYSRTMVSCWKAMPRPSKLRGRANPWTACTKTKASSPENHRDGGSLSEHHQSFPLCGEGTDFYATLVRHCPAK